MITNLEFYDGNGFKCFSCTYHSCGKPFMLFGNNESGNFRIGNYKDVDIITKISIENQINTEYENIYK